MTELPVGEPHPAAFDARRYIAELPFDHAIIARESLASTALSGSMLADLCLETWRRLDNAEPVSDRYLLGLAWTIRQLTKETNT